MYFSSFFVFETFIYVFPFFLCSYMHVFVLVKEKRSRVQASVSKHKISTFVFNCKLVAVVRTCCSCRRKQPHLTRYSFLLFLYYFFSSFFILSLSVYPVFYSGRCLSRSFLVNLILLFLRNAFCIFQSSRRT